MPIWETYPSNYRSDEIQQILVAVKTGECVSVVGLSGAGKSNLMGFIAHRITEGPHFYFIDCNDLAIGDSSALLTALTDTLDESKIITPSLQSLIQIIDGKLKDDPKGICILLDRFDLFQLEKESGKAVANNLRSLRDRFKYSLTYVISTRRILDPSSELAELFYANTLWLGPLNEKDSYWSISQYAARHCLDWDASTIKSIYNISKGYPSLLRAVCESYHSGLALDAETMRNAAPIQARVKEFWDDTPNDDAIAKSRLNSHLLLVNKGKQMLVKGELTATEQRLLDYLDSHPDQVCTKEDLITAAWPEEKLAAGMRDDSLTQLVHRLREKLDPAGTNKIQTLPGRGYRYRL